MVTIRFYREHDGTSSYQVLDKRGHLHVVRQPSPWSLTATPAERLVGALANALPSKQPPVKRPRAESVASMIDAKIHELRNRR